jgi:hypothetical protein
MYEFIIVALFVLLSVAASAFTLWMEYRNPSEVVAEPYSWWFLPM